MKTPSNSEAPEDHPENQPTSTPEHCHFLLLIATKDFLGKKKSLTFSAWFHISISPRNFSGRVERFNLNENPKTLYTVRRKSKQPLISSSILRKKKKKQLFFSLLNLSVKRILPHRTLYLVHGTEYVRVILLESSDPRESCESPGELIPMKHAKISQPQRQLSPGPWPMIEHKAEGESKAKPTGNCTR